MAPPFFAILCSLLVECDRKTMNIIYCDCKEQLENLGEVMEAIHL